MGFYPPPSTKRSVPPPSLSFPQVHVTSPVSVWSGCQQARREISFPSLMSRQEHQLQCTRSLCLNIKCTLLPCPRADTHISAIIRSLPVTKSIRCGQRAVLLVQSNHVRKVFPPSRSNFHLALQKGRRAPVSEWQKNLGAKRLLVTILRRRPPNLTIHQQIGTISSVLLLLQSWVLSVIFNFFNNRK